MFDQTKNEVFVRLLITKWTAINIRFPGIVTTWLTRVFSIVHARMTTGQLTQISDTIETRLGSSEIMSDKKGDLRC